MADNKIYDWSPDAFGEDGIRNLPTTEPGLEGYHWVHYDDGSGYLEAPDETVLYDFDLCPGMGESVEYRAREGKPYRVFYGSIEEFIPWVEKKLVGKA